MRDWPAALTLLERTPDALLPIEDAPTAARTGRSERTRERSSSSVRARRPRCTSETLRPSSRTSRLRRGRRSGRRHANTRSRPRTAGRGFEVVLRCGLLVDEGAAVGDGFAPFVGLYLCAATLAELVTDQVVGRHRAVVIAERVLDAARIFGAPRTHERSLARLERMAFRERRFAVFCAVIDARVVRDGATLSAHSRISISLTLRMPSKSQAADFTEHVSPPQPLIPGAQLAHPPCSGSQRSSPVSLRSTCPNRSRAT